jgi:DnaJ-class molecular chaperone
VTAGAPTERERVEALKVLGLPRRARAAEIRAAYLAYARTLHPDRNPTEPGSAERYRAIAAAYELLRRQARRPSATRDGPTLTEAYDARWRGSFGGMV